MPGIDAGDLDILQRGRRADEIVALEDEAEGIAAQFRQLIAVEIGGVAAAEQIGAGCRLVEAAEDVHQASICRSPRRP